jgi:NADPH-dependent glutamate synthase beta subunit-like oxidoreductase
MVVNRAEKYEKPYDEAFEEAWHKWMEYSPFPSVCGRVCPHPCEGECNRKELEGSVSINSFERFLGDFGLEKKLVPKKLTDETRAEKIAIVGAGPAGLTCAYHLARQGYPVAVFEAFPKAGGMLRYGIPDYRLPQDILDAEIKRIQDMGVEIKLNSMIGKDISQDDLKKDYKAVFVGLGAHRGLQLRVDGEDASNVFTGTDFLHRINSNETVEIGDKVVVIGGGDTAIDAARVSRRLGADVTILYRRTRTEMPAIEEEIVGALDEGVKIEYLAAPTEIYRNNGTATGIKCQKMQLGEPDASGRRRPVPIEGETFDLDCTALIAAISQEPDFAGFENLIEGRDWIKVDEHYKTKVEAVFAGGDNVNLDIAITAIAHGRLAARAIHEMITNEPGVPVDERALLTPDKLMKGYYEQAERIPVHEAKADERVGSMTMEVVTTMTQEEAIAEAKRCMSCGLCFDCGTCWSFCQDSAIVKPLRPGEPYKAKLELCIGCKKCAENCPCGFIEMH